MSAACAWYCCSRFLRTEVTRLEKILSLFESDRLCILCILLTFSTAPPINVSPSSTNCRVSRR